MGLSLSLHLSSWTRTLRKKVFGLTDDVQTVIARSISFGSQEGEMISNKHTFLKQNLEKNEKQKLELPAPLQELVINRDDETSLQSFDHHPRETDRGFRLPPPPPPETFVFSSPRPISELDHAATKLQKVYKSYRTRRNLADCAVVVEELWWKALDCAALNRSSITFFTSNEPESVASRWDRATLRASKLGKGLLKDEKAQKLALHHWLEAIDPRHRYGRNLRFYYDVWFERKSYQPFFYWLDIGDGKEVNLPSCPRADLQRQCIQYLGPVEREVYEVVVLEGRLVYKKSGMLLNTDEKSKWIFVLSTARCLYIAEKKKGRFQHSSFLSGGVTTSAGRLVAHDGILEAIWPYSGHYLPTEDNFKEFISFLEENHVDLSKVKRCSLDDDSVSHSKHIVTTTEESIESSEIAVDVPDVKTSIDTSNINATQLDLTRALSCKWASGVGARIGCVRDYPVELQTQALEKVNLSPSSNPSPPYSKRGSPIPSPRPGPTIRVSPRLSRMGIPSPRVSPSIANRF